MPKVFICYRRQDAAPYAGRLYDRMIDVFGPANVFMDIDSIRPGERFDERIRATVNQSDATFVVIGPHWLDVQDDLGNRRLLTEHDYVRQEIASALITQTVVIPVLVGGAKPPRPERLPTDIRNLAHLHGVTLDDSRWRSDVDRLIDAVRTLSRSSSSSGTPGGPARTSPPKLRIVLRRTRSIGRALGRWFQTNNTSRVLYPYLSQAFTGIVGLGAILAVTVVSARLGFALADQLAGSIALKSIIITLAIIGVPLLILLNIALVSFLINRRRR